MDYSSEHSISQWRDKFRTSHAATFLTNLLKDKSLILLGYNDRDLYDGFFREIVSDLGYTSHDFRMEEVYFINSVGYDTYLGIWGNAKDETPVTILSLAPREFISQIVSEDNAATA